MHRGLPSWVGLGLEISITSELWFGASVRPSVMFTWTFRNTPVGFRDQLIGAVFKRRRFYMICNELN
jgi:hypothetical protein